MLPEWCNLHRSRQKPAISTIYSGRSMGRGRYIAGLPRSLCPLRLYIVDVANTSHVRVLYCIAAFRKAVPPWMRRSRRARITEDTCLRLLYVLLFCLHHVWRVRVSHCYREKINDTECQALTPNLTLIVFILYYIQSVPRSKHCSTKTSQLMLYREIMAVCSEIHTKHINILCVHKT